MSKPQNLLLRGMEFGDLTDISKVDFKLKKPRFFKNNSLQNNPKEWFIGCPLWSHKQLLKRLNKTSSSEHELQTYAKSFNSIELNSSYYSIPTAERIIKWRSYTPNDFKFFPKAPKDICFHSYEKIPHHILDYYFKSLDNFGEQLGESFIQFSPYISPYEKKYLFLLLESLPADFRFSIELRHEDWFNNETQLLRLCDYLNKKNIGLVLTDTPGRRDVLPMIFTANRVLVRFKGHNNSPTDKKRLSDWVNILHGSKELQKVYFFHHHSDEQYCIDTIKHMKELIGSSYSNKIPDIDLKVKSQLSLI